MPQPQRLKLTTGSLTPPRPGGPGGARQYAATLITAGLNDNGWAIPDDVLFIHAQKFHTAPCLIDHCSLFALPSLRNYAGRFLDPDYQPPSPPQGGAGGGPSSPLQGGARGGSITATLSLAHTDAGEFLRSLFDAWLHDRDAGIATAPIGLSADMTVTFDEIEGVRTCSSILKVWSVDAVLHPAAGGRVERVLNCVGAGLAPAHVGAGLAPAQQGGTPPQGEAPMPPEITDHRPPTTPEPSAVTFTPPTHRAHLQRVEDNVQAVSAQVDTLTAQIERLTALVAAQEAARTVQGLGDAPLARGMRTGVDQITLALDALLAGTRPPLGIQPLTGIRELYHLLSGDWEMTGLYQSDRVYLANVTSATMAGLVANALNKRVVNEFQQYPQWWTPIATEEDFNTLQDVRWITLGGVGELPTVAEGASYTELTWDDQTETDAFVKKGGYLGITLEAIDKDDTTRIRRAPRALAQAAWLTLSKAVSAIFTDASGTGPTMSDSVVLFHTDHANLGTTALSWTAWNTTRTAMRKQTELHSAERLGALTAPRFILVPPDLEVTALQVLASEGQPGTADNDENVWAEGNVHESRMASARSRVIVVDLWTDTNNWAAVADPRLYPSIGIGFRYGRQPEIFSVASPTAGLMFSNDTMPVKVRFFYAVGPTDWRGLYKHNV